MKTEEDSFLNEAKKIIDENLYLARYNETLRNIEKLKEQHYETNYENIKLANINEKLKDVLNLLDQSNTSLTKHVDFLEDILNNLQMIISIKDLNHNNLLWYNDNYKRILGYRHRELQGLNSDEEKDYYHPDDYPKLVARKRIFKDKTATRHTCTLRLKHKNGRWITMNSDFIVLQRNPDGSLSRAIEILTNTTD
jgi:PAS domain S-box-containing protein